MPTSGFEPIRNWLAPCLTFAKRTGRALLIWLGLTAGGLADEPSRAQSATTALPPSEIATPPGLPPIGKWMIDKDGSIAHWLGQMVGGKKLHEPINVILIDAASETPDDARKALVAAATKAGYPVRFGHSAGYRGLIAGQLYSQLPHRRDDAFSNRIFEETNNHGRIFGPHPFDGGFLFIGAFSRESVDVLRDPPHLYASFKEARDDFARNLAARTAFRQTGTALLGNAIPDDPAVTTGDHDGRAVVLERN